MGDAKHFTKLVIRLSRDYALPEKLTNLAPEKWQKLLTFLSEISEVLNMNFDCDDENSYASHIEKLKEGNRELVQKKELIIEELRKEIHKLNEDLVICKQETHREIEEQIEQYKKTFESIQAKAISDARERGKKETESEVQLLRLKIDNYKSEIEKLSKYTEDKITFECNKVRMEEMQNAKIANELSKEYERKYHLAELSRETLQNQYESQIALLNEKIGSEKSKATDELTREYERKIKTMEMSHSTLQSQLDSQIRSLTEKLESEKRKLLEDITKDYETKLHMADITRNTLQTQFETQIKYLNEKLEHEKSKTAEDLTREYENKISIVEITHKTLQIQYESELKYLNEKLESEKYKSVEEGRNESADKIQQLQSQLNAVQAENSIVRASLEDSKKRLEDRELDYAKRIEALKSKYEQAANPLSATAKGIAGEQLVYQALDSERYPKSQLYNKAKEDGKGDIWFFYNSLKCLFEVKNKATITREDLAKFERDLAQNTEINCGVFVSLQTHRISQTISGTITVENINGKPVIYCYANPIEVIHCVVTVMETIFSIANSNTSDQNFTEALKLMKQHLTDYIVPRLTILAKREKDIKSEIKDLTKYHNLFTEFIKQVSVKSISASHDSDMYSRIKEFIDSSADSYTHVSQEDIAEKFNTTVEEIDKVIPRKDLEIYQWKLIDNVITNIFAPALKLPKIPTRESIRVAINLSDNKYRPILTFIGGAKTVIERWKTLNDAASK